MEEHNKLATAACCSGHGGNHQSRAGRADIAYPVPSHIDAMLLLHMAALEELKPLREGSLSPVALAESRAAVGLTQGDLATRLGVARSQIALWETGRRPVPQARVEEIRRALDQIDGAARIDDRRRELRDQATAAIAGTPGLTRRLVARRLGQRKGAVDAITELLDRGEVHERWHDVVDGLGRCRRRLGLFAGPAGTLFAPPPEPAIAPDDLRRGRELIGLTRSELARRLDVSPTLVQLWETGQQPVPERYRERLEEALRPSGDELRRRRVALRWSQGDLAARIGASRASVCQWERGTWTLPRERWQEIERVLEEATPAPIVDPLEHVVKRVGVAVAEKPGRPRSYLLKTIRALRTGEAIDYALAHSLIHERPLVIDDVHPRFTRRVVRRGLFPGPASNVTPLPPEIAGNELRAARERLGWSQGDVARNLGVSKPAVKGWEKNGVPAGRRVELAQRLAQAQPVSDELRERMLVRALREELACSPGLSRWEVGHRLQARRHRGAVAAAIARALTTGAVHERPISVGRGRTRLALFLGPAPARWTTGVPLEAAEVTRGRLEKGLTQVELAKLLGVAQALVSQWESGRVVVPEGRRAHIRQTLKSVPVPKPHPLPGDELRQLREQRAWSQAELARRFGVQQATICTWERSDRCRVPLEQASALRDLLEGEVEALPLPAPARELRRVRQLGQWSQAELGRRLGVSQSTIHAWETGQLAITEQRVQHARRVCASPSPRSHRRPAMTAEELRASRQRAGYSQGELAKALSVSRSLVSRWERGQQPIPWKRRRRLLASLAKPKPSPSRRLRPEELRARRIRAGVYQRELAGRLGVSHAAVRNWEAGRQLVPEARRDQILTVLAEPAPAAPSPVEIRAGRIRLSISQRELAHAIGVHETTLLAWAKGRRPVPPRYRDRLRELLAVPAPPVSPALSGTELRAARMQTGWSRADLGRRLHVTQTTIGAWERGASPIPGARSTELLAVLAQAPPPAPRVDADRVRSELARLGWTGRELARRLGVSEDTVYYWQAGGPITAKRRVELEELFASAPPASMRA